MAATRKTSGSTATAKKPAAKKPAAKATARKPAAKKAAARKPAARKPAARKPAAKSTTRARKKSPFTPAFVQKQKKALEEERARYLEQAVALQEEADQLAADREPGDVQFDEESGEGDTIAVERERDLALSAQARDAVRQIDEALDRIKRGVYGVCVISGDPIPKARLEAIPWAAERVEYKVARLGS
jgi:RNA polymerase-binding transcription factor DksA